MIYTAPYTDHNYMNIVDYYFDHIHWIGEERNKKYNNPRDWLCLEYGCFIDTPHGVYIFDDEQKRNWFVMKWL